MITVDGLEQKDEPVEAQFPDGRTERLDLIGSANDLWSRTRRTAFGPEGYHLLNQQYMAYLPFTVRSRKVRITLRRCA